jgi:hypothetical protein
VDADIIRRCAGCFPLRRCTGTGRIFWRRDDGFHQACSRGLQCCQRPQSKRNGYQRHGNYSLYLENTKLILSNKECKNCPYGSCINFGWIPAGLTAPFQCFTQGENVGNTKYVRPRYLELIGLCSSESRTWLRYAFGPRQDEFCYVSTYDLVSGKGDCKCLELYSIFEKLTFSRYSRPTLLRHEIRAFVLPPYPKDQDHILHRMQSMSMEGLRRFEILPIWSYFGCQLSGHRRLESTWTFAS